MRLSLAIGFFLVFVAAAVVYSRLPGTREAGVFNVNPPTPYAHYLPSGTARGRVLAIHGLDANRSMLNMLSYALADSGLEVFAIDLPGHGRSNAPFNALRARDAVAQVLEQLGPETLVLGHSLGAALLMDVTADHPVKSMVLFSPAPMPIDKLAASRILLFEGEFDPGRIQAFVPQIQAAAQGTVEYHNLRWTGHSGALTRPDVMEKTVAWLGGDPGSIQTLKRFGLLLLMLVAALVSGILLLGKRSKAHEPARSSAPSNGSRIIVAYVATSVVSAVVVAWIPLTAWLHLYASDYLIGYLFLTGLLLSLTGGRLPSVHRTVGVGIAAALFLIVVPGLFVVSEFTQITLSDGRWWRFPAIVVLSLPLFWADEILIRPIQSRWKAAAIGIMTRVLLTAIVITAVLTIHRDAAFLLLMSLFLVIFWIALWFAGAFVSRRTADPLATAIFLSLIQGWAFASVFVTT